MTARLWLADYAARCAAAPVVHGALAAAPLRVAVALPASGPLALRGGARAPLIRHGRAPRALAAASNAGVPGLA